MGSGHEVSSNPQCSSPSVVPDYGTVPYGVPAAKQIRIKSEWWHRCFLATHTAIRTKKILISNTKSKTRWRVDEKHLSSLEALVQKIRVGSQAMLPHAQLCCLCVMEYMEMSA